VAAEWQSQSPGESGQLRTLALALSHIMKVTRIVVAYFHAPAGGLPEVYADEITFKDLAAHRAALNAAMAHVGTGWLRPGPWCGTCPALSACPTQTSTLVALKRSTGPLTAERVGAILETTAQYDKLRDMLRDEARGWIRKNGPAVTPSGSVYELVEKDVTNLSQASIVRALGELKGRKEIERLKRLGAIETSKRVELRRTKGG